MAIAARRSAGKRKRKRKRRVDWLGTRWNCDCNSAAPRRAERSRVRLEEGGGANRVLRGDWGRRAAAALLAQPATAACLIGSAGCGLRRTRGQDMGRGSVAAWILPSRLRILSPAMTCRLLVRSDRESRARCDLTFGLGQEPGARSQEVQQPPAGTGTSGWGASFSSTRIDICTEFDVTTNIIVISFVFVNYCPNIN